MRNQRPKDFGRKDGHIEYDAQGKPRLPAQMRTGYAGGGLSDWGGRIPIGTLIGEYNDGGSHTTVRKTGLSQAEGLEDIMGVLEKTGYGPAGRSGGFDSDYYLRSNPDVAAALAPGSPFAGIDPYVHYNMYGRREGRLGSAPRTEAAAAPQASFANLTPVGGGGGGGAAPAFNANADLAAQQATGAATLAQMRGGNAPGALTAPAAAPNRLSSFTPSAGGNAPAAPAAPAQQPFTPTAGANAAPPPVAMAGGGEVNPMDPISDARRRARGEDSVSYGFEKIPNAPSRLDLKRKELLSFPLEINEPESMRSDETNAVLRADPRGLGRGATWGAKAGGEVPPRRAGYAGGGMVEELMPRQPVDPQSMIPPAADAGPAMNRFGMNRGRTKMRRGYAHGGDVDNKTEGTTAETYVTGDQLAEQVEQRFSQALEADDKYRRGYDDGGYIDQGTATGGTDVAAEEARRLQEEIERQRMAEAEAAAAAERAPAREAPAPEQAPPETERRTDPNDTSRLLPEPPALPPEDAAAQPAAPADGVPQPAQPAAVADAQASAEQQTNDWLKEIIDYSHSKLDPAELQQPQQPQQPQPEAARTGYSGRGPLMAGMASNMPGWAAKLLGADQPAPTPPGDSGPAGPATPPDTSRPPASVTPAEGILPLAGSAVAAGARKLGEGVSNIFKQDPLEEVRPRGADTKMAISDLVNGKGAIYSPEQIHQMQRADPNGDFNGPIQRTFDDFQKRGDKEGAHGFLQSMRGPYGGLIGTAQAANAAQRPDVVARTFDRALNFMPDGTLTKTTPTPEGFTIVRAPEKGGGEAKTWSVTREQMTELLNSNGVQFDAVASNKFDKHLDIATGRVGQLGIDINKLPVSDEHSGYTPMEPPMKEGAPRASDYTTVPGGEAGRMTGYRPGSDMGPEVGGKPRHPAWEGLPVAEKWESDAGYKAPSWGARSGTPGADEYGMFSKASGPPQSGITLGRNTPTPSVGPYIPAGGDQGALRIPPGGKPPPGWTRQPAEDAHEGSGWIAIPPGVAPKQKDITMYTAGGQPVPMKVPDFWDPNKIKYANEGKTSGAQVFANPPGTKFNQQGDAVRPISSYASTLASPTPGQAPGVPRPEPITRGGSDFTGPQPWQPAYGRGTAGVPPPADDTSPDAVAARRLPMASQSTGRAKMATDIDEERSKEAVAEANRQARLGVAGVNAQSRQGVAETNAGARLGAADTRAQGARDVADTNRAGAMDRTQANIAGRATAASEKFDNDMKKLQTREGGLNDRAAMRDATNRYKVDTISSDVGRRIAQQSLDHQQQQFLSTYRTKLANGLQPDAKETAAYETFKDEVARQGFRVPQDTGLSAGTPGSVSAATEAQRFNAPPPGRGRLTVPPRGGGEAGATANQTAQSMAGGQATAASATPPGEQPAPPGWRWRTNQATGEHKLFPTQ